MKKSVWLWVSTLCLAIGGIGLFLLFLPYALSQITPNISVSDLSNGPGLIAETPSQPDAPTQEQSKPVTVPAGPLLVIPSLNISVPIVEDVDTSRQYTYNMALKRGVAHMKGTAKLSDVIGNSFIFGHSSRFTSSGTPYDTIFANLSDMKTGDMIELLAGGKKVVFRVVASKSVGPNDTSVLAPTDTRQITLMSCWPLGTTLKRWIVQAQVLPINS